MKKIGAIIQARSSSERLPGKVIKDLPNGSGVTVLSQVVKRLKKSKKLTIIIIATTTRRDDDRIVNVAKREKVPYYRGSVDDVLARYYFCARKNKLDIIVRITGDCPCIDPGIVDLNIKQHIEERADYTSNTIKRTFPHGLDVEVFNFDTLEKAYKNAKKNYEKEHVTPYIYQNPCIFKVAQVKASKKLFAPDLRVTLDTKEDYTLLSLVFDYLYQKNKDFCAKDIIDLFQKKPWLKQINKRVIQKRIPGNSA